MPARPPVHRPSYIPLPDEQRRRFDRERGSAASRGYDRTWQRFRDAFLMSHPLCSDCLPKQVTPAIEVHHIKRLRDAPELRLVEANCLGLCKAHHSARTARGE